jgi:hypothetical protein
MVISKRTLVVSTLLLVSVLAVGAAFAQSNGEINACVD